MNPSADDRRFLARSVELAAQGMRAGDGRPYGAVLVRDGAVIAEGWNRVDATNDPSEHAEMAAIRQACRSLGSTDLSGTVLYASGEPCPMCLGAALLTRISRCVFASSVHDSKRIGGQGEALYAEYRKAPHERSMPCRHDPMPEVMALFDEWLDRQQKKA